MREKAEYHLKTVFGKKNPKTYFLRKLRILAVTQ
jgi:hypothetical protein